MAPIRAKNGTSLCRAFHNVTVDPETDCWLRKRNSEEARQILIWNLWHSGRHTYRAVCKNKKHCINPRHARRKNNINRAPYPYDHPHIANRWALLQWYLQGNTDYQLVSLADALQLLQQEVA